MLYWGKAGGGYGSQYARERVSGKRWPWCEAVADSSLISMPRWNWSR